jgi:hypothetical protein
MNVDPLQARPAGIERQTPEIRLHVVQPSRSGDSGNGPNAEIAVAQSSPVPPLFPEHEVKVQLDTPADDIMIYHVLDKQSGALVLQVPSAEELRAIHQTQELLQRISSRAISSDTASVPVVEREGNK